MGSGLGSPEEQPARPTRANVRSESRLITAGTAASPRGSGDTSGASVPEGLVEQVLEWLAQRGFEDVEIVKAAEESITFSLPKELRRDLREEAAALIAERTGTSPE